MAAEKMASVSFQVSKEFKVLLKAAEAREQILQTSLLENLLLERCKKNGIQAHSGVSSIGQKGDCVD